MVAYSFRIYFGGGILSGRKCQMSRPPRRRDACVGETLQLYTGINSKSRRLLGYATCTGVSPIEVDIVDQIIEVADRRLGRMTALHAFARAEGFADWPQMRRYWRDEYGLNPDHGQFDPWHGVLITWTDFAPADEPAARCL